MEQELTVETERVDGLPVMVGMMIQMGLPGLIDQYVRVHGNCQGISLGWTLTIWLGHILTSGDHRSPHPRSLYSRPEALKKIPY